MHVTFASFQRRITRRSFQREFPASVLWALDNLVSLPASLQQPDIEFGHFKRLLKAFLFGQTAAH